MFNMHDHDKKIQCKIQKSNLCKKIWLALILGLSILTDNCLSRKQKRSSLEFESILLVGCKNIFTEF